MADRKRTLRVEAEAREVFGDRANVRDRLLNLGTMAEELANTIERAIKERQSAPIDRSKRPSDLR